MTMTLIVCAACVYVGCSVATYGLALGDIVTRFRPLLFKAAHDEKWPSLAPLTPEAEFARERRRALMASVIFAVAGPVGLVVIFLMTRDTGHPIVFRITGGNHVETRAAQ